VSAVALDELVGSFLQDQATDRPDMLWHDTLLFSVDKDSYGSRRFGSHPGQHPAFVSAHNLARAENDPKIISPR